MFDRRSVLLSGFLAASTALAGPVAAQAPSPAAQPKTASPDRLVRVVATFSILADLVRQVGGERVSVTALVGPNGDAHEFEPKPADARQLAEAALVVVNGLGLEGWLDRLIKASGTKAPVVVASRGVKPIAAPDEGHGRHDDPHAWQAIANVRLYVETIRDALSATDRPGATIYAANTTRYLADLDGLEGEVRAAVAAVPPARRAIITSHDAFGYFGVAYGMRFIAPQGVSTESEASARDVARIIRQIKADKIPAVFLENISDPRLMERIAAETGARIGGKLYSDALSEPTGPAATYTAMMRNNIAAFRAALGG